FTGHDNGVIGVFKAATGDLSHTIDLSGDLKRVAWLTVNHKGTALACGDGDVRVRLVDLSKRRGGRRLEASRDKWLDMPISNHGWFAAFSSSGDRLFLSLRCYTLVFDLSKNEEVGRFPTDRVFMPQPPALSTDGKWLARFEGYSPQLT